MIQQEEPERSPNGWNLNCNGSTYPDSEDMIAASKGRRADHGDQISAFC
jgi:hypothetical protein